MSPLSPRDIQAAVVAWHNRHALAQRIDVDQVHSIGWVALPFLRPPQSQEPSLDGEAPPPFVTPPLPAGRRRWWIRRRSGSTGGSRPVFSDAFIDGVSARRAADFALRHGLGQLPVDHGSWPQRRIEVDGDLAEQSAGGWPSELWVLSAAIDHPSGRRRVLIAPDGRAVLGPRQWDRLRGGLAAAGALVVLSAVAWLAWPDSSHSDATPQPTPTAAASAPQASEPISAASAGATEGPASTADQPLLAASAANDPSAASASAPSPAPSLPTEGQAASEPDIRPQLVKPLPNRRGPPPRPMLADREPSAVASAPTKAASAPASRESTPPEAAPSAVTTPYRGAATPEQIRPGLPRSGPLIALVSPGFKQRGEAEAMLTRMTEHLKATMAQQSGLRGEVIESPEGWRAAVYPFATREEAAILNATMVARGWRTRSVSF